MKILLLGAHGQVGKALQSFCPPTHHLIYPDIDITDRNILEEAVYSIRPDVIINAAAYTKVDDAERNKDRAFAVNAVAPMIIADLALKTNTLLVHYSTDYVFDGEGYAPWTETDKPSPLNTYGSTKWEGDKNIMGSSCDYLILRTSWIYSLNGHNFMKSILEYLKRNSPLTVISDQIGAPTSVDFIAVSTYQMIEKAIKNRHLLGLYHIAAAGEVSWVDYARFIKENCTLSSSVTINPVLSKDYPQKARRPLNSRLDVSKLKKNFAILPPPWQQDVSATLKMIGVD